MKNSLKRQEIEVTSLKKDLNATKASNEVYRLAQKNENLLATVKKCKTEINGIFPKKKFWSHDLEVVKDSFDVTLVNDDG